MVAEFGDFLILIDSFLLTSKFRGGAKTGDKQSIRGAGATLVFLMTANDERLIRRTFSNVESADADGAADFVRADDEIINVEFFDVNMDFAESLSGVGMKESVVIFTTFSDFDNRLD